MNGAHSTRTLLKYLENDNKCGRYNVRKVMTVFLPIERSQIDLFCSLLLLKRSKLDFQTLYNIISHKKTPFFGKACIQLTDKRFFNNCRPFFILKPPFNTVKSSWVLIK